jgi:hypothetical protein
MAFLISSTSTYQLGIEEFLGLTSGALDGAAASPIGGGYSSNATNGSAIKTGIEVNAGDVLSFDWLFDTDDYLSFNDFSFVVIDGSVTELADISTVGSYGDSSPWATFTYTVTSNGSLEIGFGVMNTGDDIVDTYLMIDNLTVS